MPEAFALDDSLAILSRTPTVLDHWLRGLPRSWIHDDEGPDTWSPYDVVGHLIHGETTDWIPRAQIILEHGDTRPFERFDRFAQLDKTDESIDRRLDEFTTLRRASLEALVGMSLTPTDLQRRGHHPELGQVTLGDLLASWTAHDLNHIVQIASVVSNKELDNRIRVN